MTTSKRNSKKVNNVETVVNVVKEESLVPVETKTVEVDNSLNDYIARLNELNALSYNDNGLQEESKPKSKGRKISFEIPSKGTQSREIYDYMLNHYKDDSFTIYKVCKILNTPSNNTRRIYFKFFEKLRNEYLESLKSVETEKLVEYYELEEEKALEN